MAKGTSQRTPRQSPKKGARGKAKQAEQPTKVEPATPVTEAPPVETGAVAKAPASVKTEPAAKTAAPRKAEPVAMPPAPVEAEPVELPPAPVEVEPVAKAPAPVRPAPEPIAPTPTQIPQAPAQVEELDLSKSLGYTFDFPVLLMHKRINGGEPVLARLVGGQRFTGDPKERVTFERFDGTLELPAAMYAHDRGYSRVGAMRTAVQLAGAKETSRLGELLGQSQPLNTAIVNRKSRTLEGTLLLRTELPFDRVGTFVAVTFTFLPRRDGALEFSGTGRALNSMYAGMMWACTGTKSPGPPPCVVTISTTARSTGANSGGVLTLTGLIQSASSSVGHPFPAGKIPIGVKVWDNGQSMVRPGQVAVLAADGTILYPDLSVLYPTTWGDTFPPSALVELTVTVTDVHGHAVTQNFARYGSDVP